MKMKLNSFTVALCLAGLTSMPVFAQSTADEVFNKSQKSNPTQNASLKEELHSLRSEVSALKKQLDSSHRVYYKSRYRRHKSGIISTPHTSPTSTSNGTTSVTKETTTQNAGTPVPGTQTTRTQDVEPDTYNEYYSSAHELTGKDILRMISEQKEYLPFDLDVPGQAFVSTGPYIGVPIQYAGSELIINSPSVNRDVQLLSIRKSIHKQLVAMGGELYTEPYHSHLLLSGVVEGQVGYIDIGGQPSRSDIDVTNVSLDAFFIGPSDWLLGFIEYMYDNGLDDAQGLRQYYRVAHSRVFVNFAFVTIGNFDKSPVYGTFGQFYVPFGVYSSVMISDPLTKLLARTKARSILLGYQSQCDTGLYGAAYIFRGDSHAQSVSKINNGGINLGLKFKTCWIEGRIGGGVLANIADSGGMQAGNQFAQSAASEQLVHRVPAYNANFLFNIGEHINLIGEYVTASTRFNPNDMSFNNHGAKPTALDLQGAYSFYAWDRPSAIGLGYGHSNQALSLGIPMARYYLVFNTSIWRNTLQSLEFRRDKNYAQSDSANGPTVAQTFPGQCTSVACGGSGKQDKAITAQFDYYF